MNSNSAKWAEETIKAINATYERERVKPVMSPEGPVEAEATAPNSTNEPSGRDSKMAVERPQGKGSKVQPPSPSTSSNVQQRPGIMEVVMGTAESRQLHPHDSAVSDRTRDSELSEEEYSAKQARLFQKFLEMREPLHY